MCFQKSEDSILALLTNNNLIGSLNEQNSASPTQAFTWTNLWKATYRYTTKEAEKWLLDLEKHNNKTNSSQATSLHKSKIYNVTKLLKFVLQRCDKCLIKPEVLLDDLMSFLLSTPSSLRIRRAFGSDIIEILNRKIFASQTYVKGEFIFVSIHT